ncbi:MAG TPA: dienelactone hydrolase family protein [Candidatus Binatia bacterium]|nr:dienelactone hydrolase family protein [Candidatus Binatia bacterium]
MQSRELIIDVDGNPMECYLAAPERAKPAPAVIVLEGIYGFDDEMRRVTDLVASAGFVGLAINYFYRTHPQYRQEFSPEGRQRGNQALRTVTKEGLRHDVAAARDWLNEQEFVDFGKIATWGFGFGGTVAFITATLPGIRGAVVFYGQSIDDTMPSGEPAPITDAKAIRAPLLLVFGGLDEQITSNDIATITSRLTDEGKRFDVQVYPTVGHSFFREGVASVTLREIADAWDRVQAFLRKRFA